MVNIHQRHYPVILIVLGIALFFVNLGGWDLWDPDEPRYAQVAREMRESGEWILPHLNGTVYCDKPPFFFWMAAVSQKAWGDSSAFANRFPSALAALLTTLVVLWLGTRLFNPRAGFFAALVLATNAEFFWLAHRANLDATLTFFTTVTIAALYVGVTDSQSRFIAFGVAAVAAGLGFLTKLYSAAAVPGLVLATFLLASNRLAVLKDKRVWMGLPLFLLIVAAWIIPVISRGGEAYLFQHFYHKTAAIFFEKVSHPSPFYYYLKSFPENFQPWFFFFPSALILLLRSPWRHQDGVKYVLGWFLAGFLFFSLAEGKRALYLLPLYPAASLMVGFLWDQYLGSPGDAMLRKLVLIPHSLILGAVVLAAAAAPFVLQEQLDLSWIRIAITALPFFVAVAGSAWYAYRCRRSQPERSFLSLITATAAALLFTVLVVFPALNPQETARPFGAKVAALAGSADKLVLFQLDEPTFVYYTGFINVKGLQDLADVEEYFQSSERFFCLMKQKAFEAVQDDFAIPVHIVLSEQVRHRGYVLISNRGDAPAL